MEVRAKMKLIHWFSAVAIAIGTCQLLFANDTDSLSEPSSFTKSGEVTMDQVHFAARSLKRKKKHRSKKRPGKLPQINSAPFKSLNTTQINSVQNKTASLPTYRWKSYG